MFGGIAGRFTELPQEDVDTPSSTDCYEKPPRLVAPRSRTPLCWAIAALASVIWVLLFVIIGLLALEKSTSRKNHSGSCEPDGFHSKDIIPKGSSIAYKFAPAYNYSLGDSQDLRDLYSKYFREDFLGIAVREPAKYGLPPGFPTVDDHATEAYLPAFIHQFHCLILFREAWWDIRGRLSVLHYRSPDGHSHAGEPDDEKWDHVEHCMDYLRQTIMCHADTTLEAPATHPDGQRSNVDGMNVRHQCWDMDVVWGNYGRMAVPFVQIRADGSETGNVD